MPFELKRNAQLHIISSPAIVTGVFTASADVTAAMLANAIPGVTDLGYDHQLGVEVRGKGQFGANKPVGITEEYGGIKGSLDVEGTDGEKAVLAAVSRIARASYVNANYNKLNEIFILANVTADDGAALAAHFLDTLKIDSVPKKVGPDAKRFSFQGIIGRDFAGKKLRYHVIPGNAVPVTALTYPTGETAAFWSDENGQTRYALLVLRFNGADSTVKRLQLATTAAAGYYSETGSAVTLAVADGLAAADKALVAYLV